MVSRAPAWPQMNGICFTIVTDIISSGLLYTFNPLLQIFFHTAIKTLQVTKHVFDNMFQGQSPVLGNNRFTLAFTAKLFQFISHCGTSTSAANGLYRKILTYQNDLWMIMTLAPSHVANDSYNDFPIPVPRRLATYHSWKNIWYYANSNKLLLIGITLIAIRYTDILML